MPVKETKKTERACDDSPAWSECWVTPNKGHKFPAHDVLSPRSAVPEGPGRSLVLAPRTPLRFVLGCHHTPFRAQIMMNYLLRGGKARSNQSFSQSESLYLRIANGDPAKSVFTARETFPRRSAAPLRAFAACLPTAHLPATPESRETPAPADIPSRSSHRPRAGVSDASPPR